MIRHLIFIGLLLSIINTLVYSQQSDYIRGKVIDSKTSEPVPYATVRLKKAQVGVITNAEGDFRILNEPAFQSDSVIVTFIGYQRFSVAFNRLKTSEVNNLKLVTYIFGLNEVSINARKNRRLSSQLIIGRALRNIPKNYSFKPYSFVSYYRDYQKDSLNYLNLNESIIQTLDNGFGSPSDSNRYRLLEFKKNMDFTRMNMSPFYDLPESDHSDVKFKRIPYAVVGDQNGNELFILMVHDAIRNFDTRSFSFIDTLTKDFIRNHVFSNPAGVHVGNTILYKIDFSVKRRITGDNVLMKGAIFIQPDDYSIHKIEYSASLLNSEKKNNEIFSINIEYGHEPAVDSLMCLKYISFNNSFIIPDSTDNDYFKVLKSYWIKAGGPYTIFFWDRHPNMTIISFLNRKIDPVSGTRKENYTVTLGERTAYINKIKVANDTLYINVRDDKFTDNEVWSTKVNIKNIQDINGNIFNKRKELHFRQFRELFVEEYSKWQESHDTCFIKPIPLERNCISVSNNSGRYWMNTPLKTEEKQQDSQNQ
jgi:hypothetical protein